MRFAIFYVHFLLVQETNQRRTPPSIFLTGFAFARSKKQQTQPSVSDSCFSFPHSLVKSLKIERGIKRPPPPALISAFGVPYP